MASKLLASFTDNRLVSIGVWDINGRLVMAELMDSGEAMLAEAIVLNSYEQGQLQQLLNSRFPIIKTCSCGKSYNFEQWHALKPLGLQPQFTEEGDEDLAHALDLRNCSCRSTMTLEVER